MSNLYRRTTDDSITQEYGVLWLRMGTKPVRGGVSVLLHEYKSVATGTRRFLSARIMEEVKDE